MITAPIKTTARTMEPITTVVLFSVEMEDTVVSGSSNGVFLDVAAAYGNGVETSNG